MELKNMYYGVEMIKKLKEHLFRKKRDIFYNIYIVGDCKVEKVMFL